MDAEHEDGFLSFWQDEMDIDDLVSNIILDSSSDEEENRQWGGSREGRAPNKERDFIAANERVVKNYINGRQSKYDEKDFERRFRCSRAIFNKIHDAMMGKDPFIHKKDATGKIGIFSSCKIGCLLQIYLPMVILMTGRMKIWRLVNQHPGTFVKLLPR